MSSISVIATAFSMADIEPRARAIGRRRLEELGHTVRFGRHAEARWYHTAGTVAERIEDLYVLNEADVRAKGRDFDSDLESLAKLKAHVAKVLAEGAALSTRDLAIDGNDLMRELQLKPGRVIGEILSALLEAVTNDPAQNERDALLALARQHVLASRK